MMQKNHLLIISLFQLLLVQAQVPNISYATPNVFSVNEPITPLLPVNTGGNIPNGLGITSYVGTGIQGDIIGDISIAQFNLPTTSNFDSNNNLLVVDRGNHKIKKISPSGDVLPFLGTGVMGSLDGPSNVATFNFPTSIVEDSNGNFFICDQSNHRIRKLDTNGMVTTFAGNGIGGFQDGAGNIAKFYYPDEIAIDNADNIYVADYYNNRIRKITPAGIVSTVAGSTLGDADGIGNLAKFKWPTGVCLDSWGNIIVTDYGNHKIKKIDSNGHVTTIAGSGMGDVNGSALLAKFKEPLISKVDSFGNLFIADFGNHKIKKIDTFGNVTTFSGTGIVGNNDNELLLSTFNQPSAITFNVNGEMYITDYGNHKIRKTTYYDFDYSIVPNLPNGLNFNIDTGEISGIPTTISPMTDYTISVSNPFGTSSFVISIEVGTLTTATFENSQMQLYPNPIQDFLNVRSSEIIRNITIYNTLGQEVKKLIPNQENFQIDFSTIEKGIYFLKMESNDTTTVCKIVKE